MRSSFAILIAVYFVSAVMQTGSFAEQVAVVIDGTSDDWDGVSPAYSDTAGDGGGNGVDLGRMWVADDNRFLFLRVELGVEMDVSENNDLILYLDTDDNSGTGLSIGGIGAELEWRLGDRQGTYRFGGSSTSVSHDDIRFRSGPTVTALEFELAFGRDTLPDGVHPLFLGPQVRILLIDTAGGDQLPDAGDTLAYTFDLDVLPPDTPIPLERQQPGDMRIITYNVLNDSPWSSGLEPSFGAQFAAVSPDILNFQEIRNHSVQDTIDLVATWVPLADGETWEGAGNNDVQTISRFPIQDSWPVDGNMAVLIDTGSVLQGSKLLIINVHLPCCSNDAGRRAEVDRILSFIREAKTPGGSLELDADTPIIITGDTNFVGQVQQLTSVLTGDIINESLHGPDFVPDWDGSDLANLISRQTEKRMAYTWRRDSSTFAPGQLDYFIYTDSVLEVGNHYLLYTPEMSEEVLQAHNLLSSYSLASDHLLVCADFRTAGAPAGPVPTASQWCVTVTVVCLLVLGTLVFRSRWPVTE
ncbi:MAG: hypothetical protein V3W34_08120 [Phycisphaerae bacterium]